MKRKFFDFTDTYDVGPLTWYGYQNWEYLHKDNYTYFKAITDFCSSVNVHYIFRGTCRERLFGTKLLSDYEYEIWYTDKGQK